jgi:hypothetical protein
MALIGRYERLRLANHFSDEVKKRLAQEREEFRLVESAPGTWQFVPTDYLVHKVTALDDGSAAWTVRNRYAAQAARLRIQALYAVEPYESADALLLTDFSKEGEFAVRAAANGVTHELAASKEQVKVGAASGRLAAKNAGTARRGAWAKAGKAFAPHVDLRQHAALGLWVHGDGKGALLNVQLSNPLHYWPTCDEHYVKLDFTGWRYFELLLRERDADAYGDHAWPYGDIYSVYRSPLIRDHVSELNLYVNEVPPQDGIACHLSPIRALRTAKVKLQNPSVEIGGKRLVFPVALESGSYIEFASPTDCKLYDERGAVVQDVKPQGDAPTLAAGDSQVKFACDGAPVPAAPPGKGQPAGPYRPRARVTLITAGEPFGGRSR